MKRLIFLAVLLALLPMTAHAQGDLYGTRLVGRNGWKLPVATRHLTSDEHDHIGRGSVQAIDLTAPKGSAVYAMAPGKVIVANCGNAGGYGCWVMIDHLNGYSSIYGHCDTGSIQVRVGNRVTAETILCLVGWTGMTSFGPHTHLEIHCRCSTTGRIDPLSIWPRSAFFYEKLGKARSNVPVGAQWYRMATNGAGVAVRSVTVNQLWLTALGLVVALWAFWSPRQPLRNGAYHGAFLALCVIVLPYLPILLTAPPVDGVTNDALPTGQKFDVAYALTRKWEGAKCVHDPVRTYKGITNGTYNAWRMSNNLGPGDVCTDLTEQQAKAIYYNRYWLPSGSAELNLKLAITNFDFAINAGVGAARDALIASRGNGAAYNRYRYQFYVSARLCYLYCPGWLNRLNDIRRYSE